jgi:hypothetical protein
MKRVCASYSTQVVLCAPKWGTISPSHCGISRRRMRTKCDIGDYSMVFRQIVQRGLMIGLTVGFSALFCAESSLAFDTPPKSTVAKTITLQVVATNVDSVDVLINGEKRGVTPLALKLAQSNKAITMIFKKTGYFPKELRVTPHRARTIKVKLAKIPPPPRKKDPRENLPF